MRIMKPVININGTSREALIEARLVVLRSLRAAYDDMRAKLAPHGRDYPNSTYNNDSISADRALHVGRCADLHALIAEIEAEVTAIADGE